MATSSVSSTASTANLDSYFVNLINTQMKQASQPLTLLQTQKDTLTVQKSVYTDLKSYLDAFQAPLRKLISTQATYALTTGVKGTVTPFTSGSTVLTANTTSSAIKGTYNFSVTQLASAHVLRSDRMASATEPLGLEGTFVIGGAAARAAAAGVTNSSVTGFSTGDLTSGQSELTSGNYFIETKQDSGTWKFRVVDANGDAVSVQSGSTGSFSSGWQAMPTSSTEYDTGRGLKINFSGEMPAAGSNYMNGAAQLAYTAKGQSITVSTNQSLADIASAINDGTYAEGNGMTASVVDRRLVLTADKSGASYKIALANTDANNVLNSLGLLNGDGSYKNEVANSARNAQFTVNNLAIERSSNTGLTDVIGGVTINLAADAEGKSATLSVADDNSGAREAINTFVTKYNELQTYLRTKTAVTKNENGTYTRGALSGEMVFRTLNQDLTNMMNRSVVNSGAYTRLSQIGLTLDDNLTLRVSDSAKLESALANNAGDVKALMDAVMGAVDTRVGAFTGSSGYASRQLTSTTNQIKSLEDRITSLTDRLTKRQELLIKQYSQMQATLTSLGYTMTQLNSLNSATSNINTQA
ncbi:MAG TPA: flagellar filament capping protein FliD [Anaerolineaceae bacterium]|nr:flagellar filament capping protein FliD [Anaerolineaceae bacterium]HPN52569.1 flagellar filament capping protein FliD [Anaerolineaceae bacterium]